MRRTQIDALRRALADLADRPETSFALRDYLETARERDLVDVMNEIEVLAATLTVQHNDEECS
ncbi:MAG: hypothetical protein JJ911_19545 [Rhizobiaceae bacterium]|nr:hypothetical protein [Rhizobiaceae bacterium]